MTPCQERGYKVGDLFVVTSTRSDKPNPNITFAPGSIVKLIRDDGDDLPRVELVLGQIYPKYAKDRYQYEYIECLEPLT